MTSRSTLACLLLLGAVSAIPAQASAQGLERPKRRPDGGGLLQVTLAVPSSALNVKTGSRASFSGTIWYERLAGNKYRGATTLAMEDASGRSTKLPDFALQLDADSDPAGAADPLSGSTLQDSVLFRALASSDLGLLPVRVLLPHLMPYGGNSRSASKEVQLEGATVEWHEDNLGTRRLRGTVADLYFTRSVRRFPSSGFQIHDFVLACEFKDEGVVAYGSGLRLLVHPTRKLEGGEKPRAGVFHIATFTATQLEWLSEEPYLDAGEKTGLEDKFRFGLENALFEALKTEGIGDPFDSPAVFALEQAALLDARSAQRLINLDSPKVLAMTAPLLVESGVSFDGAPHLKYWKSADDPLERLLLAAGAAAGGKKEPRFAQEAEMALHSKDPSLLRAVKLLAKALNDPLLAGEAEKALGGK
ncbi:MAG: hypothetical protein HY812_21285 [Planctomycetes bacterium]|nr:hypothetical protein [Planctomycetota bacterium]